MGAAIELRDDFDGGALRRLAKRSRDGGQSRRFLALAEIYDGKRRSDAARLAGVGLQIVRDWVLRFNAEGPDGLIDRKAPGPRRKLSDKQRAALAEMVEKGPIPAIHGVVRWRRRDLAQPVGHVRHVVGDDRRQNPAKAVFLEGGAGLGEFLRSNAVRTKIDTGVAIDLQIEG